MSSQKPPHIDERLLEQVEEAFEEKYGVTLESVVEDVGRIDENVIGLINRIARRDKRVESVRTEIAEVDERLESLELSLAQRGDGGENSNSEGESREGE